MKFKGEDDGPAAVSPGTRRAGEVRSRWAWTEPCVWTDRMLTALESGVKGGRWYSLMDKVYSLDNLRSAFAKVKANRGSAGVDHQTVEMFDSRLEDNLKFEFDWRWPSNKSMKKFKDVIRKKTKRTNGTSLEAVIEDVNRTTVGWFEYFKHSHKNTFSSLDRWIRGRLRSILRKRHRLHGRGRGRDHQRWPNAYFAEHGLFSLSAAHASACQPSRR